MLPLPAPSRAEAGASTSVYTNATFASGRRRGVYWVRGLELSLPSLCSFQSVSEAYPESQNRR